uniref:glycosyltransferase n=1 Tax=Hassallia byssoidea TaxID=482630 RepID=UPI0035A0BC6D
MKTDVTFVTVSYNSGKSLRGAIESCLTAVERYYPDTGKVVVYDNASKDSCPQIIDDFAKRYPKSFIGINCNHSCNINFIGSSYRSWRNWSDCIFTARINKFQPATFTYRN